MKYCARCVIPDTRPNIVLDAEGVCNACRSHGTRASIDWDARARAFEDVAARAKATSTGYDCLIPVSGGKDSTWQVVTCLEHGLNPLTVTWKTPGRTRLGAVNLQNLIDLGVDHIDYQINPRVEKRFMYRTLVEVGSTAVPMHMALFNIPLKIAVRFEIPLVVWGENSAFEYGSTDEAHVGMRLTSDWLRIFGVTDGTTARDWVSDDLSASELTPYFGPTDEELDAGGVAAVFLGYYSQWDPETSLAVARAHGFQVRDAGPKTGLWNYADIDDDFVSIHHYLKWYKFGFTRLFDNLSVEIRNGRMTRSEAVAVIRERGDQTPHEDIASLCKFLEISVHHFFDVIEKFRNDAVWSKVKGRWVIHDFLIDDWNWQ